LAAQNNFPTSVAYLLSKNADCAVQDQLGLTAFDWAISSDSPEVVQVFLDNKVWKEVKIINAWLRIRSINRVKNCSILKILFFAFLLCMIFYFVFLCANPPPPPPTSLLDEIQIPLNILGGKWVISRP
jgi:ankyrin repeat protein